MKKIIQLTALMLLVISCGPESFDDNLEITIPVSVSEIKYSPIEEFITTTATVYAIKTASLNNEVEGYYKLQRNPVTGKYFAPGDILKKDQLLIGLSNSEYENNIKIESQKLELDISQREYEKQKSLYEKGGVTLRELINAERTFIESKYAYDNALLQLAKMKIRSPFQGVIVDLPYFTPNGWLEAGQLMVEINDYSQLYAEVNFPAQELSRVKADQNVRITHYNLPGDTLYGKVSNVSPAINPDSRSFKAMLLIDNPDFVLRPGMFVQVETIVASKKRAIVIPKEIILSKRRGKTVFVVDKGAATERVISTGLENTEQVEILEGLKAKERIVIKGFETLRNHSRVKVVQ